MCPGSCLIVGMRVLLSAGIPVLPSRAAATKIFTLRLLPADHDECPRVVATPPQPWGQRSHFITCQPSSTMKVARVDVLHEELLQSYWYLISGP